MGLLWIILAAVGGAGVLKAVEDERGVGLGLSLAYLVLVTVVSILFFRYLRHLARCRARFAAARPDKTDAPPVCGSCGRETSTLASCDMCGRQVCPSCMVEETTEDGVASRRACPVCDELGQAYRERILELEIDFDNRRERLERVYKQSVKSLLAKKGGTDAPGRRAERIDATLGDRLREQIVELDEKLETEREAILAAWRNDAAKHARQKKAGREPRENTPALDRDDPPPKSGS